MFSTLISGHEYAVNNLEFACSIDPENTDAQAKYEWAKAKRERRLTTVSVNEL